MGYDLNRFVSKVDEEFICPICTMVLENGVQSQHCEHSFCLQCIKKWLNFKKICPIDRRYIKVDQIKPITRGLKNLLHKLEIRCDFEANGCQAIIILENLHSHINVCLFNPNLKIKCDKKCGLEMTQRDYDNHDCFTQLSNLVLTQQKQINILEKELNELRKGYHSWISPNGLIVNHSIIECYRDVSNTGDNIFPFCYPFAQSKYPLTEQNPCIVIEIIDTGIRTDMVILLTHRYKSLESNKLEYFAFGSKGRVFGNWKHSLHSYFNENKAAKWEKGDKITVGIQFNKSHHMISDKILVYFQRNELIQEKMFESNVIGLYPTVYLNSVGSKIMLCNS